jgi:hypothetical protein
VGRTVWARLWRGTQPNRRAIDGKPAREIPIDIQRLIPRRRVHPAVGIRTRRDSMGWKAAVAVCLVVVSAGCGAVPSGGAVAVSYLGQVDVTSQFVMDGYLTTSGGNGDERYEDVAVHLYAENGTLLCAESIGDLDADDGRLDVSLATDGEPKYVVFTAADFWSGTVTVDYFVSVGNTYSRRAAPSRGHIPVEVSTAAAPSC